jgi:hypothetical protein
LKAARVHRYYLVMWIRIASSCSLFILVLAVVLLTQGSQQTKERDWQATFNVDKTSLADAGRNTYFVLEPGYRLTFRNGPDTLTVTVLDDTKIVDGVRTRVVEERETSGGQLTEISLNYFAIDKASENIYYFGEDVDDYSNGKVIGHGGSWMSGLNGARFGLMMPGKPKPGDRYYQELAPKAAMDRAEVVSISESVKIPAGSFTNVLLTRETSAIESGSEDKCYAPGVGLIKDAEFMLTKIDSVKK